MKAATKTYENDDTIYEEEEYITDVEMDNANLLEAQDAHQRQLTTENSWTKFSNNRSNSHRTNISSLSWLFSLSALLVAHITNLKR